VNWKNQAIFIFSSRYKKGLQCTYLDLDKAEFTYVDEENMYFHKDIEVPKRTRFISQVFAGMTHPNGQIIILA